MQMLRNYEYEARRTVLYSMSSGSPGSAGSQIANSRRMVRMEYWIIGNLVSLHHEKGHWHC